MIDTDGNFTQEFTDALPGMLGEENKDFKGFDDVKGIKSLVGMYANIKKAYGAKQENVIQRPADDATPADKDTYRSQLFEAIGAPVTVDGYEIKSTNLPEDFKEFSFKQRYTQQQVTDIEEYIDGIRSRSEAAQTAEQERVFTEQSQNINTQWPGELLPKNVRAALEIANELYDDAAKVEFKEAGLYDNASDLKLIDKHIGLSQLMAFHALSQRLKPAEIVASQGSPNTGKSQYEVNKEAFPNSPEIWGPK